MSNANGGPAFPGQDNARCSGTSLEPEYFTGMTLRDYFAANALAASVEMEARNATRGFGSPLSEERIAKWAYALADAMIAERTRRENST